jgi:hypothetical protein
MIKNAKKVEESRIQDVEKLEDYLILERLL